MVFFVVKNLQVAASSLRMLHYTQMLYTEVLVKWFHVLVMLFTVVNYYQNQFFLNHSIWLKLWLQMVVWVVFTKLWLREEVKLYQKNHVKVNHYQMLKLTYQLVNHSVSIQIFVPLHQVKPSHNVYLITMINYQVIHFKKVVKQIRLF